MPSINESIAQALASATKARKDYAANVAQIQALQAFAAHDPRLAPLRKRHDELGDQINRATDNLAALLRQPAPEFMRLLPKMIEILTQHAGVKHLSKLEGFWGDLVRAQVIGLDRPVDPENITRLIGWVCTADMIFRSDHR